MADKPIALDTERAKRTRDALQGRKGSALDSGGGPPHDPDMEVRVARLEDQFNRIEALLKGIDDRARRLEIDAGELKGRLAHLPTTWAMVTTVVGGQVALAGILFAAMRLVGTH